MDKSNYNLELTSCVEKTIAGRASSNKHIKPILNQDIGN